MPYSRLLADRKIHHEPAAKAQVGDQLAAARRDLATAQRFGANEEWSYNIAYNAMLLAGRPILDLMDRMRRQRHRIAYEAVGFVSENQIVEALKTAQEFVHNMESLLGHGASPEDSTPPAPRRS